MYINKAGCIIAFCLCLGAGASFSQSVIPSPSIYMAFDTDNPGYESVTKNTGVVSGDYQRAADRFGNSLRAIRFIGQGSGIRLAGFDVNSIHTVSFWVYISDPSAIPEGPVPFVSTDKTLEFYNWTDINNKVLRGVARKKATIGFNRFIEKSDGSRTPWYLWSYEPAQFDVYGWYHIFIVQGARYTRLIMYKPNDKKVYSYNWLGAQDFSKKRYLYIGGFLNNYGPNDSFDDFKLYNSELTDGQIEVLHVQEYPKGKYLKIQNKYTGKYVAVQNLSIDNNARIIQHSTGEGNNEWLLKYRDNNEFRIQNLHSQKMMVVENASMQTGAQIIQYEAGLGANEIWLLEYSNIDTKYFKIKNKNSGKYLVVNNNDMRDNALLVQGNSGEETAYWHFQLSVPIEGNSSIAPGLYRFKNKESGLYLDLQNRSYERGALLVQKENSGKLSNTNLWFVGRGGANGCYLENMVSRYWVKGAINYTSLDNIVQDQSGTGYVNEFLWQMMPTGVEGEYKLRNAYNYMYAVVITPKAEGSAVVQYGSAGSDNAIWIPERYYYSDAPIWQGRYKIINQNSNKMMVIKDASVSDGAQAIQYSTGEDNALFDISNKSFGYVAINNVNSGKYLVVKNADLASGADVIQWGDFFPTPNGFWQVERTYNFAGSGFELYNKLSGLKLVVKDASIDNGAPLVQSPTGIENATWHFQKATQLTENKASNRRLAAENIPLAEK